MRSPDEVTVETNLEAASSAAPVFGDDEEGQLYLDRMLMSLQARRVKIVGPLMLLLGISAFAVTMAWQLALISLIMTGAEICFVLAYRRARNCDYNCALWLSLIPTMIGGTSVILLVDGFTLAMMLTFVSIIVQMSVFSARISTVGSLWAMGIFVIDGLIGHFSLYPRLEIPPGPELIFSSIIAILMLLQFWVYLGKHRDTNSHFLHRADRMNRQQHHILQTVSGIQPVIQSAVNHIVSLSNDVAGKAAGQATALMEMGTTVTEVLQTSETTTSSAKESKDISDHTRSLLQTNSDRLTSAEKTFSTLSAQVQNSHSMIEDLVSRIEQVEEILMSSHAIGEHIKVLSVNAAIEAAEAGEKGQGFSVVALELRELIGDTEKNIRNSQNILGEIRLRTRQTMDAMTRSSRLIGQFSAELKATAQTLEMSVASFMQASTRMTSIATASAQQQVGLKEMGTAIWDIQSASEQLAASSQGLLETVQTIDESTLRLGRALNS